MLTVNSPAEGALRKSSGSKACVDGCASKLVSGLKAASESVGSRQRPESLPGKNGQRNYQLFRVVQLLSSAAAFTTAFDGSGDCAKCKNAES